MQAAGSQPCSLWSLKGSLSTRALAAQPWCTYPWANAGASAAFDHPGKTRRASCLLANLLGWKCRVVEHLRAARRAAAGLGMGGAGGWLGRLGYVQPAKNRGKHLWFIPWKEVIASKVFQGAPGCHKGWFTRNHIQMLRLLQASTEESGSTKRAWFPRACWHGGKAGLSPAAARASVCMESKLWWAPV